MAFLENSECTKFTTYDILSLPNSRKKSANHDEYSSTCPFCGGEDRFLFWENQGKWWCRQCRKSGYVSDAPIKKPEKEIITAICSKTPEFTAWRQYHEELQNNSKAMVYWQKALGRNFIKAVEEFKLGFCPSYLSYGPTFTIPVSYNGRFLLVKHRRVISGEPKYVTEPHGIGGLLFNLDNVLKYRKIIIVEGEKKAIRLWLEGYPAVSPTIGAQGFKDFWRVFFVGRDIILIFDPDDAGRLGAGLIQKKIGGTIMELPDKVDDFINNGGIIKEYLGEPWKT